MSDSQWTLLHNTTQHITGPGHWATRPHMSKVNNVENDKNENKHKIQRKDSPDSLKQNVLLVCMYYVGPYTMISTFTNECDVLPHGALLTCGAGVDRE